MKKIVSSVMLALILISTLIMEFNIKPAKAEWTGTVYIRADGSVDPPDAPIRVFLYPPYEIYMLRDNIVSSADGIVVERDNIVIDGAGYTLQGIGTGSGKGISLSGRTNVTVRNTQIKNFYYGIYLNSSSNNIISGNNITNNLEGVVLGYSSSNSVSGNNITNNWLGVGLYPSSSNNSVSGNTFTNDGLVVVYSYWNVVENNTVNGKPLVYLEGVVNYSVSNAGQVILVNCTGIKIENLNLFGASIGVELWQTNNTVISGNNITNNCFYGIWLYSSFSNSISGNNITNNSFGVELYSSSNNVISGNNITNNGLGVRLYSSSNSIISGNDIKNNGDGVYLDSSSNNSISGNNITNNGNSGVWLYSSFDNSISGNNITANRCYGVLLDSSNYNSVSGNNITNNSYSGVRLGGSSNNSISENIIMNNSYGGALLDSSFDNSVSGNNITANNEYGIWLEYSSNNIISENVIKNNSEGVRLRYSSNSVIIGNDITANNVFGVWLVSSSNERFYHNNFINNGMQVYSTGSTNVWDDGYPSGGNYWSDYGGIDLYSGPYQNIIGSDGIGDTPYVIDANNTDRYPLMTPWTPTLPTPDFSITASPTSLTIPQGSSDTSTLTITSLNGFSQFVQLSVYRVPSGVKTTLNPEQVIPPPGGSATSTLTVSVDATATPGNYTFSVVGTNGTLTHDVAISLKITVPAPPTQYKFKVGDLVWTTADLNVREGPGLNYTVVDAMIRGNKGIVLNGPVYADGYNWWYVNYSVGVAGWSAEDWLELAPAPPSPPQNFAYWAEAAIKWAEQRLGSGKWSGYCLQFVANAFMQEEDKPSGWLSALDAANELYRFNQEPSGWQHAPKGALIFFDKEGSNEDGHVGIYLGNGSIIHAYGTIMVETVEEAIAKPDVGRYLGWAYPPESWRPTEIIFNVEWEGVNYPLAIQTNSTVLGFNFDQPSAALDFIIGGETGTTGYCNITIPKSLIKGEPWTVKINGTTIDFQSTGNQTHSFIYFTYTFASTLEVTIEGTWAVPEFPQALILSLFMILSTLLIAITKRRFPTKPKYNN